MQYNVNNVKVSVKIQKVSLDIVKSQLNNLKIQFKSFCNFIVFNTNFSYTVFKSKPSGFCNHINITKIPSEDVVLESIEYLRVVLGFEILSHKIDNIIATTRWKNQIDLEKLAESAKHLNIKYNNQKFPGLFIKFDTTTALIFVSGKIVIVGAKTLFHIENTIEKLILTLCLL